MGQSANVTSLDAMRRIKVALIRFAEDAANALGSLQQEVYRAIDWLEHDRPHYWRAQVRKSYERVAEARVQLERARMRDVAGHRPSCYDEKKALALAKQRLEFTQEKVEAVRRWAVVVREEADEYRGRLGGLERCIETDIPRTLAMLERSIAALEAYTEIRTSDQDFGDSASVEEGAGD